MTPAGEIVTLRYHWRGKVGKEPREGDVLQTTTGRRYLILSDGGGAGQVGGMKLTVLVMHEDDLTPSGVRVYEFRWDKRGKRK